MSATKVIIALGSNQRHSRLGSPERIISNAVSRLAGFGIEVLKVSRVRRTAPIGPSKRMFANAAVLARTALDPYALLAALNAIEASFGRRRGRRWAARTLDLDIVAYAESVLPGRLTWPHGYGLVVPHRAMHLRRFVLDPVVDVAPKWRHPVFCRTARQLRARSAR